MTEDRIPTELWVSAHVRKCAALGVPAYVIRKGAPASGTIMLKIMGRAGACRLLVQSRYIY
jgi:hypothetical protein